MNKFRTITSISMFGLLGLMLNTVNAQSYPDTLLKNIHYRQIGPTRQGGRELPSRFQNNIRLRFIYLEVLVVYGRLKTMVILFILFLIMRILLLSVM